MIEGNTPDEVDYDPRANASAGQLITWVFIPLFGISALFAYERQQGTLRRLLTTPANKSTFLLGTTLRAGGDGSRANAAAGRFWNPGDETELGK